MQHDEFIGQVQARAHLASRGEAERATRSVLETLGERITEGLAENLAGQLPHEIGEHLRRTEVYAGLGTDERFDREEFIGRVVKRSGFDRSNAAFATRVVCEVVDEATEGDVMQRVCESLPTDIQALVSAGSTGQMRDY